MEQPNLAHLEDQEIRQKLRGFFERGSDLLPCLAQACRETNMNKQENG